MDVAWRLAHCLCLHTKSSAVFTAVQRLSLHTHTYRTQKHSPPLNWADLSCLFLLPVACCRSAARPVQQPPPQQRRAPGWRSKQLNMPPSCARTPKRSGRSSPARNHSAFHKRCDLVCKCCCSSSLFVCAPYSRDVTHTAVLSSCTRNPVVCVRQVQHSPEQSHCCTDA